MDTEEFINKVMRALQTHHVMQIWDAIDSANYWDMSNEMQACLQMGQEKKVVMAIENRDLIGYCWDKTTAQSI